MNKRTKYWVPERDESGTIVLQDFPTRVSELTNDAGFITAAQAPVQSVNGATGAVSMAQLMRMTASSATTYPTNAGMYAVVANIFTNLSPTSYWGLLTIQMVGGYQRHVFTSSQGEVYEGWNESGTVSEPSTWSKLLDNRHTIQSDASVWIGSSYDLNNFFSGVVLCYSNVQNVPSADWWHVMASGTSGTVVQIAAKLQNNGQMMTRRCAGGTWSAWEPLIGAAPPTRIAPSSTTLSVASGTTTTLKSVSLSPGIYVVSFGANFANNSTGYRAVCMSTTTSFNGAPYPGATRVPAASGTATWISCTTSFNITETTTIYFLVLHTAGSAINVAGSYSYVKLT